MINNKIKRLDTGNSSVWLVLVLMAALVVVGFVFLGDKESEENKDIDEDKEINSLDPSSTASPLFSATTSPVVSISSSSSLKVFNVIGDSFSFSIKEMRVQKGDRVKIVFKNDKGFHDWVLDEFNAKTAQIQAGTTDEIEFIADKTGTFEYYCSVGDHRAKGMVGKLVVE